jgi:hypothetical protein
MSDSTFTTMKIGDGSNWGIVCNGKISDSSVDTGSSEVRDNITIKGMAGTNATNNILSLEM